MGGVRRVCPNDIYKVTLSCISINKVSELILHSSKKKQTKKGECNYFLEEKFSKPTNNDNVSMAKSKRLISNIEK